MTVTFDLKVKSIHLCPQVLQNGKFGENGSEDIMFTSFQNARKDGPGHMHRQLKKQ